jgi:energy-converting hydrogenase Eha subunit A
MAEIKIINPDSLGKPLGQYSQITRVKASEYLYIAGQVAADRSGELVGADDFDAQCVQVRWAWQLFAAIAFLVILASILAVNALHTLMRHGAAARVTSLLYLTPVIAVGMELLIFGVVPTPLSLAGIVVACLGVAMVAWQKRRPSAAGD